VEEITNDRRQRSLASIAAVNLKKSHGGHTTDALPLSSAAAEGARLINHQLALHEPDLIVCCGSDTSYIFHGLVDLGSEPRWKTTRRGIWYHEFLERRFVVSFAHPEARVADCLLYYGLVDAVREIRFPESDARRE
jgi:hypothetical protein